MTCLRIPFRSFRGLEFLRSPTAQTLKTDHCAACYLGDLQQLRTLKLRGANLRDAGLRALLIAVFRLHVTTTEPHYLRSLDVRDNLLTNEAFDWRVVPNNTDQDDEPPPYSLTVSDIQPGSIIDSPDFLKAFEDGKDIVSVFDTRFSAALHSARLQFTDQLEDVVARIRASPTLTTSNLYESLHPGLTHLYISGNQITAQGVEELLKRLPLQVFDCGTITRSKAMKEVLSTEASILVETEVAFTISAGIKKCPTLRFLRVNHQVVTGFSSLYDRGWTRVPESAFRAGGTQWEDKPPANKALEKYSYPLSLLSIDTLVLTSVPATSAKGYMTACLKAFLEACGTMERASALYQWWRNHGDVSPPEVFPAPEHILTTQEVRLEFGPSPAHLNRSEETGASETENPGKDDFSFFPDEKTSGSTSSSEPAPSKAPSLLDSGPPHPDSDVIKSLAAFRQTQREKRARSVAEGRAGEAFWNGKLQVVRPATYDQGNIPSYRTGKLWSTA
ncbi:hypothetical protein W97_01553 [Coniosporium apollinis CBS 100218]|uniref:Leucine rich repeat protein n=1 Tax=Coniosporium apollinis (strain CBS 100218) TaxID=1168221 RepID=R7YK78_CONA1|nr:uncharacterized protein W97_01553 [Coniosporium apollinis CBS 100218]EON62332.1 hypothetical protein W97_01553 [Coniosporium apollinis CBS 100218]